MQSVRTRLYVPRKDSTMHQLWSASAKLKMQTNGLQIGYSVRYTWSKNDSPLAVV